jgi:hypothetical protein
MQRTILVLKIKIKKLFNEIDEKMREAKKCEIEKFDVQSFEGHLKTLKKSSLRIAERIDKHKINEIW